MKTLHEDIHGDVVYLPNQHNLGTPRELARSRAARRRRIEIRAFRLGALIVGTLVAVMVYRNIGHAEPVALDQAYRVKASKLSLGAKACQFDRHEKCLVCLHRDPNGAITVASHCPG